MTEYFKIYLFLLLALIVIPVQVFSQTPEIDRERDIYNQNLSRNANNNVSIFDLDYIDYEAKSQIETILNAGYMKIGMLILIITGTYFLSRFSKIHDSPKFPVFCGAYMGFSIITLYNAFNFILFERWRMFFFIEYLFYGLVLGVLTGLTIAVYWLYEESIS